MTRYERFVLWLNRFYHKQNKITICVLYVLIMAILGVIIYGATQQKASSTLSVTYSRPSYTVTFDPAGGGVSHSQKTVKLGDNYGDLPTPTRTGYTFGGWKTPSGSIVASTTQNTIIGNHTLTADWNINYYTSDLNIYNPSGIQDGASGTCNITYVRNGTTYASGTDIANENWDCGVALFPYETIITVSNIKSLGEWDITRVVIGGQTITGSNGVYTAKMTSSANVELYTTYWPDLPSSAGATFVNTQALQNSSGGRGKRVVQVNATKNASGTVRTYKYSWDGSTWSDGTGLETKTSQGDQTLYVRVYPTGGEHYRGYVQTSTTVHLNKLPMPYVYGRTWSGAFGAGGWYMTFQRKCGGALVWGIGSGPKSQYINVKTWTSYDDDNQHRAGEWKGTLISMTDTYTVQSYHSCNGYIDSDIATTTASGTNTTHKGGQETYYRTTDDGQLTT